MYQIKLIRVLSLLIMATAAAVSYSTQRALFLDWSVDAFTAGVAPIAVDLLAIICTLAVHTDEVASKGRRAAIVVLVLTGSASTAANFLAGQTTGSKVVHAAMVVLYLMAEWIAAQVRGGETPHNAPTSPGMPALIVDSPEEVAFREAQAQLRRTSSLPGLNALAQ
jgi:uncharacterized protein DUF2637